MDIKKITVHENELLIINGKVAVSVVVGSSALPITHDNALKISGNIDTTPYGYSPGNSGYRFKGFDPHSVFVQPGIQIPYESQLPLCYLVASGAMYWRISHPISHQNKIHEEEENTMYWKHGEIVYNNETGESTFHEINDTVKKLWEEVSFPLLQRQLEEIQRE